MNARDFLNAELEHAARQLDRVRRIAAQMELRLAAQGLDEVAVYERLAASKAYRQLQRDEITFHQMWLRVHRQLDRLPAPVQPSDKNPTLDETLAELNQLKPIPYRKPPTPGRNEKCSCGSNLKFKRCCGNPLRENRPQNVPVDIGQPEIAPAIPVRQPRMVDAQQM